MYRHWLTVRTSPSRRASREFGAIRKGGCVRNGTWPSDPLHQHDSRWRAGQRPASGFHHRELVFTGVENDGAVDTQRSAQWRIDYQAHQHQPRGAGCGAVSASGGISGGGREGLVHGCSEEAINGIANVLAMLALSCAGYPARPVSISFNPADGRAA